MGSFNVNKQGEPFPIDQKSDAVNEEYLVAGEASVFSFRVVRK